jgi:hypothetical protein
MSMSGNGGAVRGMSRGQAAAIRGSIIGLCVVAMLLVFQPFALRLYSIGMVLVVVGGLAFNLVPLCQAGKPLSSVVRAGIIVIVILLVVAALAMGAALLYGVYLEAQQNNQ